MDGLRRKCRARKFNIVKLNRTEQNRKIRNNKRKQLNNKEPLMVWQVNSIAQLS